MTNSTNEQLADMAEKFQALAFQNTVLQERQAALVQVINWLLTRHPDASLRYFADNLANTEGDPDSTELVDMMKNMERELQDWCAWHSPDSLL
ncbi:hypothetical protein NP590_04035 [Methylomonas sp. SURF-2]|uniref:Uncharacterized protein n=1 Tax=Methylomonas subterranea TaxID=2952225 RepID=A0ABT1TCU0_9GAMM|nr:hypothetical protein [Methylomonas sp. SURF-2]MCQ8103267.1 hypothetical protein [Methylomonas sp. SURF-2]